MGSLGWPEMLLILVVALIIFGPRKLPEIGKTLGESLAQFRRASEDFKRTWESEVDYEKTRIAAPKPADTSYSYGHETTAPAVETSPLADPATPGAPPEGTVPAYDATPEPSVAEPATTQPVVSAEAKRDWM
jgi:TatA/E family protein of Tat protein translocase